MRSMHRFVPALLVALLVLLGTPPVGAEESTESVDDVLAKARALESGRNAYKDARELYESLLREGRRETLTIEQLAKTLVGAARCAKKENKLERAVGYWETIAGDSRLPEEDRTYAQRELDDYKRAHPSPGAKDDDVAKRRAALMAKRRKQAVHLVETAKRFRDRGDFEQALVKVFEARSLDPTYEPAEEELARILAERPDRATILESLLRLLQTQELTERRNLTRTVRELRETGKAAGDTDDFETADRDLRDAIARIDESGFLETGGRGHTGTLLEMRRELEGWLRQIHERAAKTGKEFPPIPDEPDFRERTAGLQGQLFAFLSQLFRPNDARESVRFYRFGSGRRSSRLPLLSSRFDDGQRVAQKRSSLSRAGWAERHIRSSIGSRWSNPLDPVAPRTGREPRILARFGDLLAVQHRDDVMRRIESLRSAFPQKSPALDVEIRVFAADAAGTVRAMEALELRATGSGRGLTLTHRDALVEQCVKTLDGVPGLIPLGSMQLGLHETSSTELTIQQLTQEHPMFRQLGPPPLVVPADRSTYGLSLDLYAEDLSEAESGLPRCAVSLIAQTRMPTHTTIVPRNAPNGMPHTRVPQLGEHRRELHMELPHFGTLVVLGLPNPFVPSNAVAPELILLLGARRADDTTPDPQVKKDERIVADPYRQREHDLGPLATEVFDHAIDEAWPELASAAVLELSDRILERNQYLESVLTQLARLDREDAEVLSVVDGRCIATLTGEQHVRVARASRELRARETDLYRVEATWTEMSSADWTRWVAGPGVAQGESGAFRVGAGVATPLDEIEDGGRLFAGRDSTLARATQRVGVRRLQERTIVRDIRLVPIDGTRTRLVPEIGRVHQGVVIEVRPGIEREGVRSVQLRVRSARLDKIERREHPGTKSARIEVPVWQRTGDALLIDRAVTEIVGDDDTIVIGASLPGNAMRTLAVKIQVTKIGE